jgi:predicted transcriptional regulator
LPLGQVPGDRARGLRAPRHRLGLHHGEDLLVEKGAVRAKRRGQADVYTPAVKEADERRDALRALAAKAFDGAVGPMVHFLVGKLSAKEREEVRRLLEEEGR